MDYRKRMSWAAGCSLVLHVLIVSPGGCGREGLSVGLASTEEPLVLNLQQPESVKRLIDNVVPAERPVEETDLIAEEHSAAQDTADGNGDRNTPAVDEIDTFDELRAAPTEPLPDLPTPEPAPASDSADPQPEEPITTAMVELEPPSAEIPESVPTEGDVPQPPQPESPQTADLEAGKMRARFEGGAPDNGFTSFEAMKSELAPYLKEIRRRVEMRWQSAVAFQYSGTSPTRAVLDCTISPRGHLVKVQIVDEGESARFAPMCKEAIETAAPFPPFPFEVPKIYRNKNLEIRWTFSFL